MIAIIGQSGINDVPTSSTASSIFSFFSLIYSLDNQFVVFVKNRDLTRLTRFKQTRNNLKTRALIPNTWMLGREGLIRWWWWIVRCENLRRSKWRLLNLNIRPQVAFKKIHHQVYKVTTSSDTMPFSYRLKKIIPITRIAGYCASSTECSDHGLKKTRYRMFFFQISVVFFLLDVIKGSDVKI